MKKRMVLLIACLLTACFVCSAAAESFTASVAGFGGEVSVTLTIDGQTLTDVSIDGANEDRKSVV